MPTTSIKKLQFICDTLPDLMNQMDDATFSKKDDPNKWSKKEILGHLIDSATNNHQLFIRAQFETNPEIIYDQENWNRFSYYQEMNSSDLIGFWFTYNKHLINLIKNIPRENLSRTCFIDGNLLTLQFLIDDYIVHLEHHMKQILND